MPDVAILQPGRNCWRIEHARRFAMLVDGEQYFSALREALKEARDSVMILGWDIDSRMELVPGADDGYPAGLRDFLNTLVCQRRRLRIRVLSWDFAMVYALEREWLPAVKLDWQTHRRLCFRLDGLHPAGASHHQKVVVIDNRLAFVGGLDLTRCRWDTARHAPVESLRQDPDGKRYAPFHDVHCMVDGDVAAALGELAAERWQRATGRRVRSFVRGDHDPWPAYVRPDLTDVPVGIARTMPAFRGERPVSEIRALCLDAIRAADHSIYLENQYFTSGLIADALAERLQAPRGPEIAVVSRRTESGWLETHSMGVLRARLARRLFAADLHDRFRFYCPEVAGLAPDCVNVHSKVMVVDDALLTIGSANLSNRSLGLDTECNLVIEARGDAPLAAGIRAMRARLLCEHLGVPPQRLEMALGPDDANGLVAAIDHLHRPGERTLDRFAPAVAEDLDAALPDASLLDPIEPIDAERLVAEFVRHEERPRLVGRVGMLVLLALVLAGLAFAWHYTPLREWADFRRLLAFVTQLDDYPFAPLAMIALFVVGSLALIPVTMMILVSVLVFGPVAGALYALCGAVLSAAVGHTIGRVLGRDAVRRLGGARLNQLSQRVSSHGVLAMVVLRLVPLAPFTLVNLVVGASRIRLRDCLLGTSIGMLPGIVVTASLMDRVAAAARDPGVGTFALLGLVLLVPLSVMVLLRRRAARKMDRRTGRAPDATTETAPCTGNQPDIPS